MILWYSPISYIYYYYLGTYIISLIYFEVLNSIKQISGRDYGLQIITDKSSSNNKQMYD